MKCKYLLLIPLMFMVGCVSQEKYDQVLSEKEALKAELEDLKYGAQTLMQKAKNEAGSGNYAQAIADLETLKSKYPQNPLVGEALKLNKEYVKKKAIADEDVMYNAAVNGNSQLDCGKYLATYPKGRYTRQVKAKVFAIRQAEEDERFTKAQQSNTANLWRSFLSDYPNHPHAASIRENIIRLEVDEIMAGDYGKLPAFTSTVRDYNSSVSTVSIKNDTRYTLTIRYSGPDAKIISIPEGGSRSVSLSSGVYKIAASVNAANVRNYAGTESLYGSYNSSYYISSSTYNY